MLNRWERLRLADNGLLVPLVIVFTFGVYPQHASDLLFWVAVMAGGVVANVCFLASPTIEGYMTWFGMWRAAYTRLLIVAGTGFTALLAVGAIVTFRVF